MVAGVQIDKLLQRAHVLTFLLYLLNIDQVKQFKLMIPTSQTEQLLMARSNVSKYGVSCYNLVDKRRLVFTSWPSLVHDFAYMRTCRTYIDVPSRLSS